GYRVHGVERSAEMLVQAEQKRAAASLGERLRFSQGDVRSFELGETFGAAICMFAVLGYQTTNEALLETFRQARKHLDPGGLFICDFWYGAAVLHQRPTERAHVISEGEDRIIRIARPTMDLPNNIVHVRYDLFRLRGDRLVSEVREVHSMRYFFRPE